MADYELTSVPMDKRRNLYSITSVWVGYVFILTSMMAGAGLAAKLPLWTVVYVTIGANIFLAMLASFMSMVSFKSGYTFAFSTRFSFGVLGSRLPSILYALIQMGWYTIQSSIYGHLIAVSFGLSSFGEMLAMVISAIVMGVFGIIGIKALELLSFVSIPAMVFICIGTALRCVSDAGGWEVLFDKVPVVNDPMSIVGAIGIVIGTWVFGAATTVADFNRFAKSRSDAIKGAIIGLLIVNSFVVLCGAIAGSAKGDYDMVNILTKMGLVVPAFVLLTTNLWTTNGANLYSVGLTLSNVFKLNRVKIMYIVTAITACLTLFEPYKLDAIFGILITAGILVPPLAGIVVADFLILNHSSYPKDSKFVKFKKLNIVAIFSWIVASASAYYIPWGIQAFNGLIVSFVVYAVGMKIFRVKVFNQE